MPRLTKADEAGLAYLDSEEFVRDLANDDGSAAKEILAAGFPIYYCDDHYPDLLVKKFPNGHRQLITLGPDRVETIIRDL